MEKQDRTGRREFVACCVCACCAGVAGAANPPPKKTLAPRTGGAPNQPLRRPSGASQGGAAPKKTLTPPPGGAVKAFNDFGFCGMYCAACRTHLVGGQDGKKCVRCVLNKTGCAVYECAKAKKVVTCALCAEFMACEKLRKRHESGSLHRKAARKTCMRIRAVGLEKAAAEQKARWACKSCGGVFYWNEGTDRCPSCQKPVERLSAADA
jgi:hypothetical protein